MLCHQLVVWHGSDGSAELHRALTPKERADLQARADALEDALAPLDPKDFSRVDIALASLFAVYHLKADDPGATVQFFRNFLAEYPAWVIEQVCVAIGRGETIIDKRFPPKGPEIAEECRRAIRLYVNAMEDAKMLLKATVDPGRAKRTVGDQS